MSNRFEDIMKERSDSDLIKIVTVESDKYETEAIEAATLEANRRNLDLDAENENVLEIKSKYYSENKIDASLATTGSRFLHAIIDTVGFLIILLIVGTLVFMGLSSVIDVVSPILVILFYLAVYIFYYSLFEFYFQKTLGKLITGTRVVKINGERMSFGDALSRSACRLIPFDWLSFLLGKSGWHDTLSDTKVIKDKALIK